MDVNIVREAITVLCFLFFLSIVAWAWSGSNRERFAEAARLPLEDDAALPAGSEGRHE